MLAARAARCSPPRCAMVTMVASEHVSCSKAAIICVVRLVLDGHSASAARRVAWHTQGTCRGARLGRFVKPLPCAFPTRAESQL